MLPTPRRGRFLCVPDNKRNKSGMTSNVAEYEGLMMILEWLKENNEPCVIIGDSELVIHRMDKTKYKKLPTGASAQLASECALASESLRIKPTYKWEPRMKNWECDAMCGAEIKAAKADLEAAENFSL